MVGPNKQALLPSRAGEASPERRHVTYQRLCSARTGPTGCLRARSCFFLFKYFKMLYKSLNLYMYGFMVFGCQKGKISIVSVNLMTDADLL